MYIIIIGEEEEYAKRLMRYLETHMPEPIRLYCFTQPENLLDFKGKVDFYLLGEAFYQELAQREAWMQRRAERIKNTEEYIIFITSTDRPDSFCRYHKPKKLLDMICALIFRREHLREEYEEEELTKQGGLTAVFSPVFEPNLRQIVTQCMESGDIYIGMEDVGTADGDNNMGDLCYFIHLHEDNILLQLKDMLQEEAGRYYLDSPNLYFDLLELGREEYEWFFHQLKNSDRYSRIFLGLGSAAFQHLYYLGLFDNLILIDSKEDKRVHACCGYLEKMLQAESHLSGEYTKVCREDFVL